MGVKSLLSGRGEAWYRVRFGAERPPVRIRPPRLTGQGLAFILQGQAFCCCSLNQGDRSYLNRDGRDVSVTGVLNDLFAALLAEPFDSERLNRALLDMGPADYERIEKLHASLDRLPDGKRQ